MKKTYTDTTMIPKSKGSTSFGASKAGGSASVGRIPFKVFDIWMGRKSKNVTLPTDQYDKVSKVGPYPGVNHFTDDCTY